MAVITMKQLLETGVHFGHQTRRWNPKMREYIYTSRDDIYIIDLQKTAQKMEEAYAAMKEIAEAEGKVLFVHSSDDPMVKYDYSTNLVSKKCKNKNIKYYVIEGKKHQPHYTYEACEKLYAYNEKIKGMPKEELDELKKQTDFLAMGVIDPDVMDKVVELIEE